MDGRQRTSQGEVCALPTTVVVFAFLESSLCTFLCLSHPITLVSKVYSVLRGVSELGGGEPRECH